MALRKTGKSGKIYLPTSDGVAVNNQQLAKTATKTIGGITYSERFYGLASSFWNRGKAILVAIQGILGNPVILPTASNDEVSVSAFPYLKDAGAVQSAAADISVSLTRPATGKYAWNLIVYDEDDGAISAVKGTDGDSYSDTWDGAGGPPLVAVDKKIIGGVKLFSNVAAVVEASAIVYTLSTGVMIQERADIPTYDIHPLEGGVLLTEALLACHTGSVARKVYASFYNQYAVMQPLSHTTKWSLSGSGSTVSFPAQNDVGTPTDLSGTPTVTGSLGRYAVDSVLFKAAMQRRTGILRLYRDINQTTEYYECAVIFTSFSEGNEVSSASTNEVGFTVDGILEWRGNE